MGLAAAVASIASAAVAAIMAILARQQVRFAKDQALAAALSVEHAKRNAAAAERAVDEARRSADAALAALPVDFDITPRFVISKNSDPYEANPMDLMIRNAASTVFVHSVELREATHIGEIDADGWTSYCHSHELDLSPVEDQPVPVRLHHGEQADFEVPDDLKANHETLGGLVTMIRYSLTRDGEIFERKIESDYTDTVRNARGIDA